VHLLIQYIKQKNGSYFFYSIKVTAAMSLNYWELSPRSLLVSQVSVPVKVASVMTWSMFICKNIPCMDIPEWCV